MYDQAPAGARGTASPPTVHWVVQPTTSDGFLDGALWAFSFAFDTLFGSILGPGFFDQATNVEVLQGGQWVPLA